MDRQQQEQFERALERKHEEAERKAQANQPHAASGEGGHGVEPDHGEKLIAWERPQDVPDPRSKNAGKGKKTADKWNQ
jgi:hypothetical protein